jgi:hypothetical protein
VVEVSVCGRVVVAAEEDAGVEAASAVEEEISIERHRRQWRRPMRRPAGTLEFWDESRMTRGGLLFIGSKISEAVLN